MAPGITKGPHTIFIRCIATKDCQRLKAYSEEMVRGFATLLLGDWNQETGDMLHKTAANTAPITNLTAGSKGRPANIKGAPGLQVGDQGSRVEKWRPSD